MAVQRTRNPLAIAAAKLRAADDERRQAKRNILATKLDAEGRALAILKIEKAAVEGERRTVDADLGPVRYLAALLGGADEVVLRWFIFVVALLLDPAAVCSCWPLQGRARYDRRPRQVHPSNRTPRPPVIISGMGQKLSSVAVHAVPMQRGSR